MKKWSEIKQGIVTKLFMEADEVNNENDKYAEKFAYFANECLNQIANDVKPKIATFRPVLYQNSTFGVNIKQENGKFSMENPFGDIIDFVPNSHTIYVDVGEDVVKKYVFKHGELQDVTDKYYYYVKEQIRLPEDFLSFTGMVNYVDNEPDPDIVYYTDNTIVLTKPGMYQIFYNALWEPITEENMDDRDLPIDQSVLNCIPSYVASQILAEDDVQRSTMLRNEYELMLSRLDTNIMYQQNSFKSTGGWY